MNTPAALPSSANRGPRILLASSSTVLTPHFAQLCDSVAKWADVKVITKTGSLRCIDRASLPTDITFYTSSDEWTQWTKLGDPVLHIELCRWADVLVIAPLSAHSLGKIAIGLCDDLLTCVVRAWDYDKPMFISPAMSSLVWNNQFTEKHLHTLDNLGAALIRPVLNNDSVIAEAKLINHTVKSFCESRYGND